MMNLLAKCFVIPVVSGTHLAEFTLTAMGIVGLIVGLFVMPSLELSEAGFYLGLVGLVVFMVLCFCAGQLVVIRERLESTADEH